MKPPDAKAAKAKAPSSSKQVPPEEISLTDVDTMLEHHGTKRQKSKPMTKEQSEAAFKRRWALYLLMCLVCGLIVPLLCIVLAVMLQQPGVEGGQWPYVFLIPAGVSWAIVALVSYTQRGPGGVLERRGYKVGCLPCTARQDDA